ncbi:MAG: holo-ACP synthase [Candidatus Gastranaerophilales bacterium]|nr:holo-ACP synthase [Candidatus Gastranaerophilales bacterium]
MAIGVDIEDIKRFENKPQKFLDRIFTRDEQEYCLSKTNPASHFTVRFCAKEAVIKALNSININHPQLNQIEIYHENNKLPKIKLPDKKEYNNLIIEISLSHDKTKAIAFVVIEDKMRRGVEA